MRKLCEDITDRSVGSEGNREATKFFHEVLSSMGWEMESQEFSAVDWREDGASLSAGDKEFDVLVSPYALGCDVKAPLAEASCVTDLEKGDFTGTVLLLRGDLAREQLMPKNFVFFNPEEHRRIIALLEESGARALVCATGRNAGLAGGVYPFPLIEDGDFDIPSVYMTEKEGERLKSCVGNEVLLRSDSRRIPGKGYNVIAKKGITQKGSPRRIVVTAHIDAKKGTPGAIDNATGVTVLLLLGELLKEYSGSRQIELVAFNGEDYFSVPGQMKYIEVNQENFEEILVNINIDGCGYRGSPSAISFYGLPLYIKECGRRVIKRFNSIVEGPQWPQGDHSIFIQYGRPAIAASSKWFIDHIDSQDITHTPKDNLGIVDHETVVELASGLHEIIKGL